MKLLKETNRVSGILAVVCFLVMLIAIRIGKDCQVYYISGVLFLIFAALFLATAVFFSFRSLWWHIRQRKLGVMVRHYLYALVGFYLLLMVLDYIAMHSISWGHNLLYAPLAALIQIYLNGWKLENPKAVRHADQEPAAPTGQNAL